MLTRYTASADNTIVSAYQPNLTTRGTGSNAGEADVVEIFSIYGRQQEATPTTSGSQELSRCIIQFPVSTISADRSAGTIPSQGNVSFYLRMFNAPTSKTVPTQFKVSAHMLTEEWEEGDGLDLEGYRDLVNGNFGSDWVQRKKGSNWSNRGGTYSTTAGEFFEQTFETGLEDLEMDITSLVEKWLDSPATPNYGVLVKLSGSFEASASAQYVSEDPNVILNPDGVVTSYYTKRFFARGSQYFYKRPLIEARWDDSIRDDRTNFYYSSSRAPAADNLNTLYFYNVIRGKLVDIPSVGTGEILVSVYSGSADNSEPSGSKLVLYDGNTNLTGGWVSTGVYSCSVALTAASTPIQTLYDVWHSGGVEYFTGSIEALTFNTGTTEHKDSYYINVTNMKKAYSNKSINRFNVYTRNKDWQPTIYTVANNTPDVVPIVSASYRVYRILDGLEVIPYGTGSDNYTGLSYDVSGNYFDLDMRMFEAGYAYALKFAFYDQIAKSWQEQDETFKFKVEEF